MTDLELLVDLHLDGERQGPGSIDVTKKAMQYLRIEENKKYRIADIGCGTGAQTITLAKNLQGHIIAVDLFPEFLRKLKIKSKAENIDEKITIKEMSMESLNFKENEFDIIWSEGAIYNIGFENGIKQWKKYLKPGGFLAVSEITWITNKRPLEIERHWNKEYPEIDSASNKIKILEENGYTLVGYFILPEECWIDNYYYPMEQRFEKFLNKHNNLDVAKKIVASEKDEIIKYQKYKTYYSYGFYIAQKK
jgi:SAM-dependent methyltransferase